MSRVFIFTQVEICRSCSIPFTRWKQKEFPNSRNQFYCSLPIWRDNVVHVSRLMELRTSGVCKTVQDLHLAPQSEKAPTAFNIHFKTEM